MNYIVLRPIIGYVSVEIEADNTNELLDKINNLSLDDYDYPGTDALDVDEEFESMEIINSDTDKYVLYEGEWKEDGE